MSGAKEFFPIIRKRGCPRDIPSRDPDTFYDESVAKFKRSLENELCSNNNWDDRDLEGRKLNVNCDHHKIQFLSIIKLSSSQLQNQAR